jgi:hypothetical protein
MEEKWKFWVTPQTAAGWGLGLAAGSGGEAAARVLASHLV